MKWNSNNNNSLLLWYVCGTTLTCCVCVCVCARAPSNSHTPQPITSISAMWLNQKLCILNTLVSACVHTHTCTNISNKNVRITYEAFYKKNSFVHTHRRIHTPNRMHTSTLTLTFTKPSYIRQNKNEKQTSRIRKKVQNTVVATTTLTTNLTTQTHRKCGKSTYTRSDDSVIDEQQRAPNR